jgi:hypothetical protein
MIHVYLYDMHRSMHYRVGIVKRMRLLFGVTCKRNLNDELHAESDE